MPPDTFNELMAKLRSSKPTAEQLQSLHHALTESLKRKLRDPECGPEWIALAVDFLWDGETARH